MGLLDEAIREHIELKRSHGADPTEVARLEREAFGPPEPVRLAQPALDEPGSFVEDELEPPTRLHAADERFEQHFLHEVPEHAPDIEPPIVGHEDHLVPEDEPPRPHGDPADLFPDAPAQEPPPPAPLPAPTPLPAGHEPPPPDPGQPTREFDLDEVRAASADEPEVVPADEEPEGEDVLEETPEFLQETPEHDRLWFEQRPPRDFDF